MLISIYFWFEIFISSWSCQKVKSLGIFCCCNFPFSWKSFPAFQDFFFWPPKKFHFDWVFSALGHFINFLLFDQFLKNLLPIYFKSFVGCGRRLSVVFLFFVILPHWPSSTTYEISHIFGYTPTTRVENVWIFLYTSYSSSNNV